MRKLVAVLILYALVSATLMISARTAAAQNSENQAAALAGRLSPDDAKKIIEARARQVITAIRNRDMAQLSSYVHPAKGVRFSQYGSVFPEKDRRFTRQQIRTLFNNNRRYLWGEYDGSGDPIRISARQYFKEFVYQQDMLKAKDIYYNTPAQRGNSVDNIYQNYPRAIIVEYYHEGIEAPRGGAMDWQSLTLAFEKMGQTWYLVGVVSNEWTI